MNNKIDGISVVIPYYNGKQFIEYTLRKLYYSLELSELNYEIILVNDNPSESVEHLKEKYPDLVITNNQRNMGIAASRNMGKKISKYNYIYFIDQDDWVEDSFFKKAKEYLEKGYDVVLFNCNIYHDDHLEKQLYRSLFKIYLKFLSGKLLIKYGNVFITPGQIVLKKDILKDFIVTETKGSDDYFLFLDLFMNKVKIKYVEEPLFNYRSHNTNYSKTADFKKSSLECFDKYKLINPEIIKYEKLLKKRHSGDIFIRLVNTIIKKLIMR